MYDSSHSIVIVLGPAGAGKSHFINTAGKPGSKFHAPSRADLTGEVSPIQAFAVDRTPSQIILIDTPGFDNGHNVDDLSILGDLNAWLDVNCSRDAKLEGIIYLHNATEDSSPRPTSLSLLSSEALVERLLLVTTKWDLVPRAEQAAKKTLFNKADWAGLHTRGARTYRFENNSKSAWIILDALSKSTPATTGMLQDDIRNLLQTLAKRKKERTKNAKKSIGFWARIKGLFGLL